MDSAVKLAHTRFYIPKLLTIALSCVMPFLACDITTPELPMETKQVNKIEIIETGFPGIPPGSVITGEITVTLPVGVATFDIKRVDMYVDSLYITSTDVPPYSMKLRTNNYVNGDHMLSLAVHEKDRTMGLLNLTTAPRLVCGTIVTFDQTPPQKVSGLSIGWDGDIVVRWNPVLNKAFKSYKVSAWVSSDYDLDTYRYTTEISDRNVSSWRVSSPLFLSGASMSASIAMDNGTVVGEYSQVWGTIGIPIPVTVAIRTFWQHPAVQETFAWGSDNRMYVLSHNGLSVIRSSGELIAGTAMFHPDGSRFYIVSETVGVISEYLTSDFSHVKNITFPAGEAGTTTAVVSSNGRIYVCNYHGLMTTIDLQSGATVDTTTLPLTIYHGPRMAASPDGKFIIAEYKSYGGLCKINLQSVEPLIESSRDYIGENLNEIAVSEDNTFVIASVFGFGAIHKFRMSDLSTERIIPLVDPKCGRTFFGLPTYSTKFLQDGNDLFVVSKGRYINQVSLTTNSVVKSWCVLNDPGSLSLSRDGSHLLIGNLGTPVPNFIIRR